MSQWCYECDREFERGSSFTAHMRRHAIQKCQPKVKQIPCQVCDQTFTRKRHLISHLQIHNADGPYNCSQCDKVYTKRSKLEKHLTVHTGDKPYSCEFCQKSFTENGSLTRHRSVHTGEGRVTCSVCGKSYCYSDTLLKHIRHKHPSFVSIYQRAKKYRKKGGSKKSLADSSFVPKHHLDKQDHVHTGQQTLPCSICSKTFTQRGSLNRHLQIHKERNTISDKKSRPGNFYVQRSLKLKQDVIHIGEQPHACSVCPKTFTQSSSRNRHMAMHTGENMITGIQDAIPTGERQHACSVCRKTFSQSSSCNRHMAMHTGGNAIIKGIRGRPYSKRGRPKKHTNVHPDNENIHNVCDSTLMEQNGIDGEHVNGDCKENQENGDAHEEILPDKARFKRQLTVPSVRRRRRCEICDEMLADKNILARHMQIHAWETALQA